LDISKAFDSVFWEYLIEMMCQWGFPVKWWNWVSLLLSTSSSSVMLNATKGQWIKYCRGLKQGDPLSPFLFILAIDSLQFILGKTTEDGLLSPLHDRTARLRLSLYADDAAVFLNTVREEVDVLMEIMHKFREATGLKINVHKSTIVPIRCSQINLDNVLQNFAGARAAFTITYLRLPITVNCLRVNQLQYALDRAANKMQGWQANLLNIGGSNELVKTVLSSQPTYLLMAIKPPKKFYKEMDKLRRQFLWARTQRLHGGKCKVNWQRVCQPMNRGGLGITDLDKFGWALWLRWL
jgi:hypothetical protein